jgi:cytochrome P450
MRITAPAPDAGVDLDHVDLFDETLYTHGDPHLVWRALRAERPVFWNQSASGQGFWVVTRHEHVRRVLAEHETFSSQQGTVLMMLGVPDPAGGRMLTVTDPPLHREIRGHVSATLTPRATAASEDEIRAVVRQLVAPAWDGGVWDMAAALNKLPVAAVLMMMGLPLSDVDPLLRWTYASIAPNDPHFAAGSPAETVRRAHYEIMDYFAYRIADRRGRSTSDFIGRLLAAELTGRPMTDAEIIFNCYNLLVGAVITTPQAITATMLTLAELGDGTGSWPADVSIPTAVEEALRWSSPSIQFLRYALCDTEIDGVRIGKGDAVAACIASANRDERVFDQPFKFDLARTPNRHLAFGIGPHRCAGHASGRQMLRVVLEEFVSKLADFDLTGPVVHLVSNGAAAVVSAPILPRFRADARPAEAVVSSSTR